VVPSESVSFLPGGLSTDHRGQVSYVNGFPFSKYKRFYVIENHEVGFVRAWHGHKYEAKAYYVLSGEALVGAVQIDDWDDPSTNCPITMHTLSATEPGILFIPGGHANGLMSLKPNTKVMLFSDFTLEESLKDDIRFDPYRWDPWTEAERQLGDASGGSK
jgi:dTDP-4-dehydrorhamnose 3,5-epimerase-like enzyme